jgi:S-(hydroxymethyl)glutathione dehydrogenase/alcohol dehydrogenase
MQTRGAIVRQAPGKYEVVDLEVDDPRPGEIQVKLVATGLCHSDDHVATGDIPVGVYPFAGGHEGAGVVTKVGRNVTGIEEGDHVILAFIPACGECPPCLKGYRSLCDRGAVLLGGNAIADGTSRVHAGTTEVSPMNLLGTFAPT